jgi:L-lactate dehydrogenase complex protein LldE
MSEDTKVALFVTCLVDLFRPSIGFAAVELLEKAGFKVEVPVNQTCCGQPNFNSGDRATTRIIARKIIDLFSDYDYVVIPSGSCGGMLKKHYPTLFAAGDPMHEKAVQLSSKVYELSTFLVEKTSSNIDARFDEMITYHDSCAGVREMGIRNQPRELLQQVDALQLKEMNDSDVCCGFGGTFCVKYPDISNNMLENKIRHIQESGADCVVGGDLGCILNIEGKLHRDGHAIPVYHYAEVLVNSDDGME